MASEAQILEHWDRITSFLKSNYPEVRESEVESVDRDVAAITELLERRTGQSRSQIEAVLDQCYRGAVAEQSSRRPESQNGLGPLSAWDLESSLECCYEQVHRRPLESLLISFGAGLLVASVIGGVWSHAHQPEPSWADRLRRR